jgi:acetoin utilization deacetylase AcuC-like enzyme
MPLIVVASPRFAEHQTPPGHPESPARARVMDEVADAWRERGGEVVAPRAATTEQLARVHDAEYLRTIAATAGRPVAFDPDTFTSPESTDVALLAAGAAIDAVERVMGGEGAAFALVRPPGHHAERARAMGFCLYNNIAVAAAHARTLGASRVAIVDYDVHHGNGTQHMFEDDPSVLYISTHEYPQYPGTGAADEAGRGRGLGCTVNLPLEAGAVDEDYRVVFAEVVLPVLRQFKPDVLLVSAGFDGHERDPLAGMRLTTEAFRAMTTELRNVAIECCAGRIALIAEGGYDLQALHECLTAAIDALAASPSRATWPEPSSVAPSRGHNAARAAMAALSQYWRF